MEQPAIALEIFEQKIKEHLNESEEDHKARFDEFKKFLSELDAIENWKTDRGTQKLVNDFLELIDEASSMKRKTEHFRELAQELKAHHLKKPAIRLPTNMFKKRQKRIKTIRQEMVKLDKTIKRLNGRELSLDDLEDEESNVLVRIDRCKKRVVKLFGELRKLENKLLYYGDDSNDLNFNDLTENDGFNKFLAAEILIKFVKTNTEPDYHEIVELVEKFNKVQENENFDSEKIFKQVCAKFQEYNASQFKSALDSYLDDNEDVLAESDELKTKLDSQNKFQDELAKIVETFIDRANKEVTNDQVEDEESEDSESDSIGTIDTISENEEEFIGEESSNVSENFELEGKIEDEHEESDSQSSSDDKRKRKFDETRDDALKRSKIQDDCIILD